MPPSAAETEGGDGTPPAAASDASSYSGESGSESGSGPGPRTKRKPGRKPGRPKKRARPAPAAEPAPVNTEVPFKVVPTARAKGRKARDDDDIDAAFSYSIQPRALWDGLERFRHFVIGDEKFSVDDHVFVNHSNVVQEGVLTDPHEYWVGRILEIRAQDASHVYVKINWMYWPNELPDGRQYYHGKKELVASNHVDVIDAMSVSGRATVTHWLETDEDDNIKDLFWRQRYDSYSGELKPVRKHCTCQRFYNPDTTMIRCASCKIWLHEICLIKELIRAYRGQLDAAGVNIAFYKNLGAKRRAGKKGRARDGNDELAEQVYGPIDIVVTDDSHRAVYRDRADTECTLPLRCMACRADIV
ncbi:uncharacterized protein V1510DRAFT_398524 [Dipodascopsis tothii]|uniref:uncharacterized protein n=1 Tax=Dipodascopsis tothii TaxID=44089 RepID=UPI0034CD4CB1